ncbi:MAG TPA: NADPH-dependent assimilatory sulfite reductase hemoprotein subunit [Flavisolibacter sp.]
MSQEGPLSPVEKIKQSSDGLRGSIAEGLKGELTGAISDDDQNLVKFHGMYQQDDRDRREERAEKKLERLYSFMIRLRLPGGFLTADQWIATHHIAGKWATDTIKITTRQTLQLHGLLKGKVKPTIQAFNSAGLDSIATCGDINRNVACSSHPKESPVHAEVFGYADKISTLLMPKTKAYYDIWLDDELLIDKKEEIDPLYQDRFLPRKFKIGIGIPPNNDVDVLTNDIGLIAIIEGGVLKGFNVAIGGGLSSTHGNPAHYARLATVIGFVAGEENTLKAVYEILTVQRDFGNRSDRKRARLKYTLDEKGVEFFKSEVERRCGFLFEEARPYEFKTRTDHYGWEQASEGLWHYTVFVENGRVVDEGGLLLRTALLEIAETGKSSFRFTSNQNVILSDISEGDKALIGAILDKYGIALHTEQASALRKAALACVAFPTCPLALAEAQRYMPSLISKIEPLLLKYDLTGEQIIMRMTGCPNGCARSANAEIGLIGTAYGKYNLQLGGDHLGLRLNSLYRENIGEEEILAELDTLFGTFVQERLQGEGFGDFCFRKQLVRA